MPLTKLPHVEFIPGKPGQDYSPAYTVCTPEPEAPGSGDGGHYETVCDSVCVPIGYVTQEDVQYNRYPGLGVGDPIMGCGQVCRTVWVGG